MAASAEKSNQSVTNIFEEFREWISGKNLIIPILVGCFVYSICICTIGDVEDYCYRSEFLLIPINAVWEWIHGFEKQKTVKHDAIPVLPNISLPELPKISLPELPLKEIKRNFEREKFALILVSLLFLGVFVYHLVKWIKAICCGWNNKTILRINSDGRWEYAPSIKRNEAHKCK